MTVLILHMDRFSAYRERTYTYVTEYDWNVILCIALLLYVPFLSSPYVGVSPR
jgi:hypothetical protein